METQSQRGEEISCRITAHAKVKNPNEGGRCQAVQGKTDEEEGGGGEEKGTWYRDHDVAPGRMPRSVSGGCLLAVWD